MEPIDLSFLHLCAARHAVRADTSHHAAVIRQCVERALTACSEPLPTDADAAAALAGLALEESTRPDPGAQEPA